MNRLSLSARTKIIRCLVEGNSIRATSRLTDNCKEVKRSVICGTPDADRITTAHNERHNLTMRMQMRRFTRLTNAFSKKFLNHAAAVNLHMMHYNFVRVHQTLRCTPAMEAGISDHIWDVEEIVGLLDWQPERRKQA